MYSMVRNCINIIPVAFKEVLLGCRSHELIHTFERAALMHFDTCTFPRVCHHGRGNKCTSTTLQSPVFPATYPQQQLLVFFLICSFMILLLFFLPIRMVTVDSVGFTREAVILGSPCPSGIFFRFSAFPLHTVTCGLKRSEHARLS